MPKTQGRTLQVQAQPFTRAGRRTWRLLAQASALAALAALAACGGGGGGDPSASPSATTVLDGDSGALQVYAGATRADSSVNADQVTYTLMSPSQPQTTRQVSGRSLFLMRGLPSAQPLSPAPMSQVVWVKQGRIYRLPAQGALNATPIQVSGLTNVCEAGPIDKWAREDSWLLVKLADGQGNCGNDANAPRQRLVGLSASTTQMGVDAGLWNEVAVMGMLPGAKGGAGPVLIYLRGDAKLAVLDPSGSGALGTSGSSPLAFMDVATNLPLHFQTAPEVAWQQGVLQANGQLIVLDWHGPQLASRVSSIAPTANASATLLGVHGGDFLLSTPLQVIGLSPLAQDNQGLARATALATFNPVLSAAYVRGSDTTLAWPQSGCTLVQHGATLAANFQASLLEAFALNPATGARVPTPPQTSTTPMRPSPSDGLIWVQLPDTPPLQSLTRVSCTTSMSNVVVHGVAPLTPLIWFSDTGRQSWLPFLRPPTTTGFAVYPFASGMATVLTDARLGGYQNETANEVDWGPLPQISGEQVIGVAPRLTGQHSSDALLFDLLTQDAQGTQHGALVSVRPLVPNSLRLIRSGLPVPTSVAKL
ncbi:MAG: hypothetical protein RI907_203 [Pseudomonadota bacterium]